MHSAARCVLLSGCTCPDRRGVPHHEDLKTVRHYSLPREKQFTLQHVAFYIPDGRAQAQ